MKRTLSLQKKRTVLFLTALSLLLSGCQINNLENVSSPRPSNGNIITLAAVGDISCNKVQRLRYPCADADVAALIRSKNPDHVLLLGDIQYQKATTRELQENFAANWSDLLDRSIPIPGNHEYRTENASDYFNYFDRYPKRGYFIEKINDTWSILAINTNENCEIVRCDRGSKQYKWLKNKLADLRCVIAISHHPRFSTGEHGSSLFMNDVYQLLKRYHVSVLLSGHDHHYERFDSKVVQYVVGTGGKDLRSARGSEKSFKIDDEFGSVFLSIQGNNLQTKFIGITGEVFDNKKIHCI